MNIVVDKVSFNVISIILQITHLTLCYLMAGEWSRSHTDEK